MADVINMGQVMLAMSRTLEKVRDVREMCLSIERNVLITNANQAYTIAESLHEASVELLEQCEEYARSIDPSFGVKT